MFVDTLYQVRVDPSSNHCLHHGEMLEIIVGLKQSISCKELYQNAPNAPDITRERPPQAKNDLGRSVVASGYDGRVVFIFKRGRAKVNQSNLCVK